ncbi:MAG: prepilin-type N-terminal cleavage/methylation domain-containing protein [Fimbriimonadaceae bacterium]|nr:prepilin-type N-terminal cleavage/methylation domain-containing protein [Fimbriimonadaceae bacterium]
MPIRRCFVAQRSRVRGVTLVEVLIVIAILAVIAAIIIPVTISAKERGKVSACITNLSQIGTATQLYTADYDSLLPTYMPGLDPKPGDPYFLPWVTTRWIAQLKPHGFKDAMAFCPSDPYKGQPLVAPDTVYDGRIVRSSYTGWLGSASYPSAPLDAVRDPAGATHISDQTRELFNSGKGKNEKYTVHGEGCSQLFLDWHVKHSHCPLIPKM